MNDSDRHHTIDVGALASRLVRISSCSHEPRQEESVALCIRDFFLEEEIECRMQEVSPGRPNVYARVPGKKGPGLLFCGHTDTVPCYDMKDAFSGEIRNGMLHGRGACDMKGALASMMAAMAQIKRKGILPPRDLYFAAIADEEETGRGAELLASDFPDISDVIIGEPTSLRLCLGHKGLEWIRVRVTGKKVHSGQSDNGVNAITMAGRFVCALEDVYQPEINQRHHPLLGPSTINIGTIRGGDQASTVPDLCEMVLDRRFLPEESRSLVYGELEALADNLSRTYPGFSAVIEDAFKDEGLLPHLPFCTDAGTMLAGAAASALKSRGLSFRPEGFPAWSDGGMLHSQTGCNCIILGPGSLEKAHSADECVPIHELERAVDIYESIALNFGAGGPDEKTD